MPSAESTVLVPRPPAQVWALVADQTRLGEYIAGIRRVELIPAGATPGPGVVRRIFPPGGAFAIEERLATWDEGHGYTYEMVKDPWPITGYESWVEIAPEGAGTRITWGGRWEVREGALPALAAPVARRLIAGMYARAMARLGRALA